MGLERWFYVLRLRLRSVFRGTRVENELDEELRDHLEHRTAALVARGLTAHEARDAALRSFGGLEQRKEECRDARQVGFVEDAGKDLVYAARMMRRSPVFTAVAILSLSIGIGANTAIFTLYDAVLLKPLPVDRPDELRTTRLVVSVMNGKLSKETAALPYRVFEHVASDGSIFSETLAFMQLPEAVATAAGRPLRTPGGALLVSPNYFRMLGVGAQMGRVFDPADAAAARDGTVVLTDAFWTREFGRDPEVLGRTMSLNGVAFTIAGIAPASFFGLTIGEVPDLFVPLGAHAATQPSVATLRQPLLPSVRIVGRLRPGVTDAMAADRLNALRAEIEPLKADQPAPVVHVHPIETGLSTARQRFAQPLLVLMAMVAILLLIGCANVATMLLSRASARRTEIVIRSAIGAGHGRLLRQMATESSLLVAAAAVLGILFAGWATRLLVSLMQYSETPLVLDLTIDRRVLAFAIVISAIAALVAGLTPALHAIRVNAGSALKERRQTTVGGGSSARLGQPFVMVQVALSLALLVSAGLLARTLHSLTTLDAGFNPDRVVLADVNPAIRGYTGERLDGYFAELYRRLRNTRGVEAVSLMQFSFLTQARTTGTFAPPGFTPANDDERIVQVYQVGPQFFAAMSIRLIEGRDFDEADMAPRPSQALILNETAARRYFGDANPVGRELPDHTRIVGVARDSRYNTLRDEQPAVIFSPYPPANRGRMTFIVRVSSVAAGTQAVATAIRELDPIVPVQLTTFDRLIEKKLGQERLLATIAMFFGGTALLLLSLGLYGVMAFWVSERTSEIGIRLALGAQRREVLWSVLRRPLTFVAAGTMIGIAVTLAGSRFIANLLYGLPPQDPVTIGGAALLLVAVAAAAGIVPARRAMRVDPVVALRCE